MHETRIACRTQTQKRENQRSDPQKSGHGLPGLHCLDRHSCCAACAAGSNILPPTPLSGNPPDFDAPRLHQGTDNYSVLGLDLTLDHLVLLQRARVSRGVDVTLHVITSALVRVFLSTNFRGDGAKLFSHALRQITFAYKPICTR